MITSLIKIAQITHTLTRGLGGGEKEREREREREREAINK